MTKEECAEKLDGIGYGDFDDSSAEWLNAKENNLVVVFGYSDDNMELRGAIDEEIGCYNGATVILTKDGIFDNFECEEGCKYFKQAQQSATASGKTIRAVWCPKDANGKVIASWAYETDIPHAVFNVVEYDEIYCKGIVFSLNDL
jgi:hypothetical protein